MKRILFWLLILLMAGFTVEAADGIADLENQIKGVLQRVSPSLVKVVAENDKKYVATGIAIEADFVLTSALITRTHHEKIYVETAKGETFPAAFVGKDDRTGLTLLKLAKNALPPARTAGKVAVGDWVALVGVFYDQFPSIYQGIVSSVADENLILNAPVAPGSAGGAVVNRNGELIGVIRGSFTFAFSPDYTWRDVSGELRVRSAKGGENLCYAVPMETVMTISDALKKYGRIRRGWLGVNVDDRARIESVSAGAPAEKAGLRKGDEIRDVDGKPVRSSGDLVRIVRGLPPGVKSKIELLRDGKSQIVEVEVGELKGEDEAKVWSWSSPMPPLPPKPPVDPKDFEFRSSLMPVVENFVFQLTGSRQLGIDAVELTPELAGKFKVQEGNGLMVSRVLEQSAAQKAGFQAGDIIVRANGSPVKNVDQLRNVLRNLKDKGAVLVECYRDGQAKKISVVPDKQEDHHWEVDRVITRMKNWTVNEKDVQDKLSAEKARFRDELKKIQMDKDKIVAEVRKNFEERKKMQMEKDKMIAEVRKNCEEQLDKLKREIEQLKKDREKEI